MSIQKDLLSKWYSIQPLTNFQKIIDFQKSWQDFTAMSLKNKQQFFYENGYGYEFKGKKRTFDEKDNFHFGMDDVARLKYIAHSLSSKKTKRITQNFIQSGIDSFEVVYDFMFDTLIDEIEPLVISGCDIRQELLTSSSKWVQRSLFYHPGQDMHTTIADSHPDKGFITLAYFASETGLEILDSKTGTWKRVVIPPGSVLIMFGLQGQYLTGSRVRSLYHRVLNSDGTIQRGRYAQVAFCDNKKQPHYNKVKHGSTQLKPTGFNYYCEHELFLQNYL